MLTVVPEMVQTPAVVEEGVAAWRDAAYVSEVVEASDGTKVTVPGFGPKPVVCAAWLVG